MLYLPDTNACAIFFRGNPGMAQKWAMNITNIRLSSLVLSELRFGAAKADSKRQRHHIAALVAAVPVEPFIGEDAEFYPNLRAELEKRGQGIGPIDTLIAAQALRLGATIVTHNLREYRRVPGLKVEDWQTVA